MSRAISVRRGRPPGDIGRENNLLRVLPEYGANNFWVRIDVQVRLICGFETPL